MKKKKIMLIILILVMLLTTGCGKNTYILDKKNKPVTSQGQTLQSDIFCKPSKDTEMYKLYTKYEKQMKVKLSKLPECSDFKINSNKTKSLWQFLFVKPLAYLILKLGDVFKSWGMTKAYLAVSLMVIGLIIRIIILPFNIKTQKQSKNMQKAMPEIQRIEKKYANRTDNESIMLKSQETMAVYKKYNVSPALSCILALIQLPIFLAFLQAIYKIPTIYEGSIFGLGLGVTPKYGIINLHQYSFIILIVLIILTTFFSFNYTMKQNQSANVATGNSGKQLNTTLIVMTILISIASFSLPTAIALYWIVTYAFIIIQTFIMNLLQKKKGNKTKQIKSIKDKIKVKEGLKYGKNN